MDSEVSAAALRERFLFPDVPAELCRRLSSKKQLNELCRSLGIPAPGQSIPTGDDDVREFAERSLYPVVLKRVAGWAEGEDGSVPGVLIARDRHELLAGYRRMASHSGAPNVLLQEYIPGGSDSIWMFDGYFDAHSECLVGFTGQKLRQCGPHTPRSSRCWPGSPPTARKVSATRS